MLSLLLVIAASTRIKVVRIIKLRIVYSPLKFYGNLFTTIINGERRKKSFIGNAFFAHG